MDYKPIIEAQRKYFESNITIPYTFRIAQLKKLLSIIKQYEPQLIQALYTDLHKSEFEAFGTETGVVTTELNYYIRDLKKWMRPKRLRTPLFHFIASSFIQKIPYGNTLIIAPWNYPFLLTMRPLIGAIAAGNTAIIKPSENAPATAAVIEEMINKNFDPTYLYVANTDAAGSKLLLAEKFDYIFFTGGAGIGKIVYQSAAENLTPVTLELGGKNPCIIDETANLDITAGRITWGKFGNSGQTCVAPDYLLVHESIKSALVEKIIAVIKKCYGENVIDSPDYARIINQNHFNRIVALLKDTTILFGGDVNTSQKFIAPTLLEINSLQAPVMQEEIFGPLLPIITYKNIDEVYKIIAAHPNPLVLYLFSKNKKLAHEIAENVKCGDMTVNEAVLHFGNLFLPVGGIGSSGMGKSQGRYSFDTFSHNKSVVYKKFVPELQVRYPPYGKNKLKQLKWLFKYVFYR